MSTKYIHSLSDENTDLQRQIGCMNGIFQLFDRHHFLGGGRRGIGQNRKSLPAPAASGQSKNNSKEPTKNEAQKTTEKNHKKAIKEKHRHSTESSRTSFSSSSCSSSFSSLECNNLPRLEPCSSYRTINSDVHGRDSPVHQPNPTLRSTHQTPDLRDVVKDSIYREARGLSVKTASKGETGGYILKYFDSPRPIQHPEYEKLRVSGSKESFQVLSRVHAAPGKTSVLRDARRFSCDGRETRDASKSTLKLKELPRLSLDSRAGSTRGSAIETKSNDLLGHLERGDAKLNNFSNQVEEPESCTRLSNVVAKLMGLEALPNTLSADGNSAREIKTHPGEEKNAFLGSSKIMDETKQNKVPGSPRNLNKEPSTTQLRNVSSVKKPIPNSKFPIEPAPWKQLDGNKSSQTPPVLKSRINIPKSPESSLTVYGEIEKRLAQLEFKRSGKDLRALKQILEAMQKTKEIIETRNKAARLGTEANSNGSLHQNSKSSNQNNLQSNSPTSHNSRTNSPKSIKSPIVIMKPAKLIQKACNPVSANSSESVSVLHELRTADCADGRTTKDLTPRANNSRDQSSPSYRAVDKHSVARLARQQTLKEPQSTTRDDTNAGKVSGSLNPRQQQKKSALEKQAHQTTPSTESIRTRRQPGRQPPESGSPRRKPRPKALNLQPSDDESSDIGSDVRELNHQGDAFSLLSESTISLASHVDEEVSSIDRSNKTNNFKQQAHQRQRKPVARTESTTAPSEQPSPVSVLDATFYSDDLPSPIKTKSIAIKEDEVEWNLEEVNCSSSSNNSSLNSVINHKKVENIHFSLQNLRNMLSTLEEHLAEEITPLYNITNPDHKYILDILLASGLLRDRESDLTTSHHHQADYPINPDLFLALEQARASMKYSKDENGMKTSRSEYQIRIRRKLLFDVVNEFLSHKLFPECSHKYQLLPTTMAEKRPRGQQLLGELCSNVDSLQDNASKCSLEDEDDSLTSIIQADLIQHSDYWTTCRGELPWLVLDVERLIFKDLINEIVMGEMVGLRLQFGGRCRQLFPK